MPDTTRRDALERSVACRLPACTEAELEQLDARLIELEKKRELLEVGRQVSASESVVEFTHCPLCGRHVTEASTVTVLWGGQPKKLVACPCADMFRGSGVVMFDTSAVEAGLAELARNGGE